jgi:two-component system sensor histidine kinase KdpD
MDVDAILARKPCVALVDELAHTNIEGSKHRKRYEDVLELLDAGIDVLSTMNIQHLESVTPRCRESPGSRCGRRFRTGCCKESTKK